MAAVELDVDGVDAVLPGDEPDGVLVWAAGRRETVSSGNTGGYCNQLMNTLIFHFTLHSNSATLAHFPNLRSIKFIYSILIKGGFSMNLFLYIWKLLHSA